MSFSAEVSFTTAALLLPAADDGHLIVPTGSIADMWRIALFPSYSGFSNQAAPIEVVRPELWLVANAVWVALIESLSG